MIPLLRKTVWSIVSFSVALILRADPDMVVADFEGTNYGDWKVTGTAFGPGPARGTLPGQMPVHGFEGKGLVNSFYQGDGSTGTLTSPEFVIQRPFIRFLMGGGKNPQVTCMNLLVDGKVVRSATGPNDKAGGTEDLYPEFWEVREFVGQKGVLEIVDQATGGWGHINVDQIVQSDNRPPGILTNAERTFAIGKDYLFLPIKNGGEKRKVTTLVDGRVEVENEMELANGAPDWWAFVDTRAWHGKTVTIRVDRLREDSSALKIIHEGDAVDGAANLYGEPLRGQFHFSARRGWNNDPNGMCYFNGEYHLFFQHNPYGWGWGNMHWGHAMSPDMVHWTELGDVLQPDKFGPMFSGSAVVDFNNTSGLGQDGKPPMVLIYTAAGNPTVQCIASSVDGRTFTKYLGNPVLKQITDGNRDPKVMWYEPSKKWVMVLYVGQPGDRHSVHFLTSPNLRDWTLASVTEGKPGSNFLFECPDFFELPVDGNDAARKWVLMAANHEYAVGSFDGTRFSPETSPQPGHRGTGFYAAQTFSGIPQTDGRRIQIGWFQTETKGMPFNQSMTLPYELRLTATPEGPRLTFTPVRELETLRVQSHRLRGFSLGPKDVNPLATLGSELVELRAEFEPGRDGEVRFGVRGAEIVFNAATEELMVNGHRAPSPGRKGRQELVVFCDRTCLEVFAGGGQTYIPLPFQPKSGDRQLSVSVTGASVAFSKLEVYELGSAWRSP